MLEKVLALSLGAWNDIDDEELEQSTDCKNFEELRDGLKVHGHVIEDDAQKATKSENSWQDCDSDYQLLLWGGRRSATNVRPRGLNMPCILH